MRHIKLILIDLKSILRHMGELSSEQLKQIYEDKKNDHTLTQMERKVFEQQWVQLCNEKEVLRIWVRLR